MTSKDDAGQHRANRSAERETEAEEAGGPEAATEDVKDRVAKISDDVDAILDEIDDVLEENAEEFVRGYVQKGGE